MTKLKPMEAQEALNYLEKYLLGDNYYIVDPVNNMQGNAIIVDEIVSRYKGRGESPASKWRRRHKKCIFCKHCSYTPAVAYPDPSPWCDVKMKCVNERSPRHFCSAFQLKSYLPEGD